MTRILVVEDDFGSRKMMLKLLEEYGQVDSAVDGQDGINAFRKAFDEDRPYGLVFLDIMMPHMDGQEALVLMRKEEQERSVAPAAEAHIIMTTVLEDPHNVVGAYFKGGATSYIVKPVERGALRRELARLGYTSAAAGR